MGPSSPSTIKPAIGQFNHDDPLAKGCVLAHLFDRPFSASGVIYSSVFPKRNSFSVPAADITTGRFKGERWLANTSTRNTNRCTLANVIASGTTLSIAARIYLNGLSTGNYSLVFGADDAHGFFIFDTSGSGTSGKFNFFYSLTDHNSTTAAVPGNVYDIVYSVNAGNGTLFVNGVADATTFSSVPSANFNNAFADVSNERFDGKCAYLAMWVGRAIGKAGAMRLRQDPYLLWRQPIVRRNVKAAAGGAADYLPLDLAHQPQHQAIMAM